MVQTSKKYIRLGVRGLATTHADLPPSIKVCAVIKRGINTHLTMVRIAEVAMITAPPLFPLYLKIRRMQSKISALGGTHEAIND